MSDNSKSNLIYLYPERHKRSEMKKHQTNGYTTIKILSAVLILAIGIFIGLIIGEIK